MKRLTKGYACWFRHTDGRVITGTYRGQRKVVQISGMKLREEGEGRIYDMEETIWSVPNHIPIHVGAPPAERRPALAPAAGAGPGAAPPKKAPKNRG